MIRVTNWGRLINLSVVVLYLLIFFVFLALQLWSIITKSGISFSSLIYWLLLFGWLGLLYEFKWGSSASLTPAFILFIIAAILATFGLRAAAETVMRISFIGWMVGIAQALIEYQQSEIKTKKPNLKSV